MVRHKAALVIVAFGPHLISVFLTLARLWFAGHSYASHIPIYNSRTWPKKNESAKSSKTINSGQLFKIMPQARWLDNDCLVLVLTKLKININSTSKWKGANDVSDTEKGERGVRECEYPMKTVVSNLLKEKRPDSINAPLEQLKSHYVWTAAFRFRRSARSQ